MGGPASYGGCVARRPSLPRATRQRCGSRTGTTCAPSWRCRHRCGGLGGPNAAGCETTVGRRLAGASTNAFVGADGTVDVTTRNEGFARACRCRGRDPRRSDASRRYGSAGSRGPNRDGGTAVRWPRSLRADMRRIGRAVVQGGPVEAAWHSLGGGGRHGGRWCSARGKSGR